MFTYSSEFSLSLRYSYNIVLASYTLLLLRASSEASSGESTATLPRTSPQSATPPHPPTQHQPTPHTTTCRARGTTHSNIHIHGDRYGDRQTPGEWDRGVEKGIGFISEKGIWGI
jgi:hypothetical protein